MEKELIKKAKSGDKEAFADLYLLYKDRLYRYAFYRLGNEQDASDALSLCILHAFKGISALKSEKAFCSWIFRIMHFSCLNILNERNTESTHSDISEVPESFLKEEANVLSLEIKQALEILNESEREIVLLSTVAGYKSREVAELIGSTPGTVRSTLSRSLSKMRTFLSE